MNRIEIRAEIDRIEREITAGWGAQAPQQLVQAQERYMRARERQVCGWRHRAQRFVECVVAALSAAQR